jgi:uncharacterized protein YndB with AHSA1/START domain
MTIAPVVKSVTVKASPERAFELFTRQMARWWPATHKTGKSPFVSIVVEPQAGGRWFERDAEGVEMNWGKVLAWDPPRRVLFGWQLDSRFAYDPNFLTEVELTFAPAPGGGAVVTLEHRNLERFGADAEKVAAEIASGWPAILADFAGFADAHSSMEAAS